MMMERGLGEVEMELESSYNNTEPSSSQAELP